MIKNFLIFACFLVLTTINAQSLQNQVVGALGSSVTMNTITLNQTVGEVVVANSTVSNVTLQQGFQQGFTLSGIYWNGSSSASWSNPLNWDGGVLPTITDKAIVTNVSTSPILSNSSSTIYNLELRTSATLNILKDGALTISNNLTNTGVITVNSDALDSGVLLVKGVSTGNITYNRGGLLMNKWSLLAPPVKNQTIVAFAQNTANEIRANTTVIPNRFAIGFYNDANAIGNKWGYFDANTNIVDEFEIGAGYSLSRASDGEVSYTGALETSDIVKNVTANQWNAIGNSFTSYYPINKNGGNSFLDDNTGQLDIPAAYIWDNAQDKYISITNLVSSVERFFTPAQGFFVKPNTTTTLLFDDEDRSPKPTTGTHNFNKVDSTTSYIKLFIQKENTKVETSIIYSETATKDFDINEDIENFGGANFDINTHLVENSTNKNYTIQSLPKSEIDNLIVPIHLTGTKDDEITFTATLIDFPTGIKVYLEDKLTNTFTILNEENSELIITLSENVSETGRFYLRTSSKTLSTSDDFLSYINLYKIDNQVIRITGLKNEKVNLKMYDVLGKEVFKTNFTGDIKNDISLPNLRAALYLIDVSTDKGKVSKKIIIE